MNAEGAIIPERNFLRTNGVTSSPALGAGLEGGMESTNLGEKFPAWIIAIVVVGAALTLAGALIAAFRPEMMVGPNANINPAAHIYAGYLFSRNLALGLCMLVALLLRARASLNAFLMLAGFTQIADAVMDCLEARWPVAIGVLVLGAAFLAASAQLSGVPFWRARSWRALT